MSVFDVHGDESYLDNAATTMVAPEVVEEMQSYLEERYGNPETPYRLGREARAAVEDAREKVAALMNADPSEVFFTSGGTEANNWAIKGGLPGKAFVMCSKVEHSSVLEAARWLVARKVISGGLYEIPVDGDGIVDVKAMARKMKKGHAGLVSVQFGNNEVGTVQPLGEILSECQKVGSLFHSDAVQAYGKMKVDVKELPLDFMTVSSHKIHGPMGVGALYVRKGADIEPLLHGGDHESGMRAGTVPVAQIVGFGKAAEMAMETLEADEERMRKLSESLVCSLVEKFDAVRNGSKDSRLPHIVSVTLPGVESALVAGIMADQHNFCVGTGSACGARRKESHVLNAMGSSYCDGNSTLRISLSRYTTKRELIMLVAHLQQSVAEASRRDVL
jgi:cysteine desulfurase